MARGSGWIWRAAGAALLLAVPLPAAADSFAEHAPEIIADLQALRDPALFAHGGYDIAEADGGYLLTLHGVRFVPQEQGFVDAGDVTARFTPEPGGYRLVGFDLPKRMPVRLDGADGDAGEMRLAGYDIDGSWSVAEQAFLSLDVQFAGLELLEADGEASATLASGRSSFADTPTEGGTWREEGTLEIRGWKTLFDDVSALSLAWTIDEMNRDGMEEVARLLGGVTTRTKPQPQDGTSATIERLRNAGGVFGSARATLDLRDVRVESYLMLPPVFANGRLDLDGTDLDQELSKLALRLRLDGMDLRVPSAREGGIENAVAPTSLDLSLAVERLPAGAAWNALLDGLAPEAAPDQTAMSLVPALQAAGTRLRIDASRFAGDITETYLDGMIQAHAAAAFGVVLALSVDIVGLDALSALARAQAGSAEAASDEASAILELVAWLERNGTPSTAPSGAPSRRVDIAVDGGGQLTVNGRPLPLFGDAPSEMDN